MPPWLEKYAPQTFAELALPDSTRRTIESIAITTNPPHLVIAGPAGVGKTAVWRLIARQVLGSGWKGTSHILQARDLVKTAGAMAKFESFLRPEGRSSADTLAGRSSLEAFDRDIIIDSNKTPPPAGKESSVLLQGQKMMPISRFIVIEDADYLGPTRQPYLRRMMENEGYTTRFIFTARSPSRILDALRSRTQQIRIAQTSVDDITNVLNTIVKQEGFSVAEGLIGDIVHVCDGNLRKGIFLLELIALKGRADSRESLHELILATTMQASQILLEQALRGRLHEWKWEKDVRGKNSRTLKGAMGQLDKLMQTHALESEDITHQLHQLLISGRLLIPEGALRDLLDALAKCDVRLQRSMHNRIQFEQMFHEVAHIGTKWGLGIS